MSGRAILTPVFMQFACTFAAVVVVVVVDTLTDFSGVGPVGGLFVVLVLFLADQWYVFGARKLGLLPPATTD